MSDSYIIYSECESECEIDGNMVNNITPYNFEPKPITRSRNAEEKETTSLPSRANNKDWCKCGRCRPMETEEESKCCRDNGEVPESYFSEHLCITSHANFTAVYLQEQVLKITLYMLNNIRGDTKNVKIASMRYAGYRQYT